MFSVKFSILALFLFLGFSISLKGQESLVGLSEELSNTFATYDTLFRMPFIDIDEWRDKPVRHRYVHGGFKNTETRFSFYFPPKEAYQGRFFQYITPFPDNENLSQGASGEEDKIGFSISSGAYFIETNGGGKIDFAKPGFGNNATIGAYRANAAAAAFSRIVAMQIFGGTRPFGYAFGGSGGAYRTIAGIENTEGVWDGVVPYVLGSPMAIPNVFAVRMNAMRVLHEKMPRIIDAMDAGGSGDMYAGLNDEEAEALREATKLGFPPASWFGYKTMGIHGFIALYQGMRMADPGYFEDFWKVNGYLGANPTESLLKARIQEVSKIKAGITIDRAVELGLKEAPSEGERGTADLAWKSIGGIEGQMPVAFQIADVLPDVNFMGGDLVIKTGEAAGKVIQLASIAGDKVVFGPVDPAVLAKIKTGDEVYIDNSNFLAVQTYHRHQVPGREYKVWEYWRDSAGNPKFPQRPMLLGPLFTMGAAGVLPNGAYKGKMILVCSLWDREAFPWQGDFYRDMVKAHLNGTTDDHFRLWYTDRALHGDLSKQEDPTRTVSYLGVMQQALIDLSAWVEKGIAPPASTDYKIEDGQVIIPPTASERKGIQPVVTLTINGKKKETIEAGEKVKFTAIVEVPPNAGKIILAEWDFEGAGTFPVSQKIISFDERTGRVSLKMRHKFNNQGTYFPTLRVASQREGDSETQFTRIRNLDRVRVEVVANNKN